MFLIRLLRYLRGYVCFEARGDFIERFLNLTARDRVAVWNGRKRTGVFTGYVPAAAYSGLRGNAKKAGIRIRIVDKKGLPFLRRRYRSRKGILAGVALFTLFLMVMSQFIWSIHVSGNDMVSEEMILRALEEMDIRPGVLRASIEVRESESRALLLLPELSWLALNIDGSVIHVEVSESVPPPEMVDPMSPCNVVASKPGQIVSMRVYEGQRVLRQGDAVREGQVIISGITQDRLGQNLFRHARAEVIARVTQEMEVRTPLNQTVYQETGKTVKRNFLRVFGFDLPLFLPVGVKGPYRVDRGLSSLSVFSLELPFALRSEAYILMREIPVTYSEEEAKHLALSQLEALEAARLADAEILERTLTGKISGDEFVIQARYVCLMDIAREKEILQGE